jgi:hypothetical protein
MNSYGQTNQPSVDVDGPMNLYKVHSSYFRALYILSLCFG